MLLVAVGAVIGHVLPVHAHAEDVATSTSGPSGHHDDEHLVYRASCEALQTAPARVLPTAVVVSDVVTPPPSVAWDGARVATLRHRAESPPLFLLHAALLI